MSSFDALKNNFKGDLVTPEQSDYEEAIHRWAKKAVKRAKIVAFVKDAYDASLAVRFARESGMPLAVRGGGHNPAGSSSSELDSKNLQDGYRHKKLVLRMGSYYAARMCMRCTVFVRAVGHVSGI